MRLEEFPFLIGDCIESAIEIVEYQAVVKGLNIAYFIEKDATETVIGDPARLKQILINLLNNGIKFTEKGEITIHVRTSQSGTNRCFSILTR